MKQLYSPRYSKGNILGMTQSRSWSGCVKGCPCFFFAVKYVVRLCLYQHVTQFHGQQLEAELKEMNDDDRPLLVSYTADLCAQVTY